VAALTKPDPLPPHSAIDRDPDYYDPAQAAADAAYRRKTVSEPGYDPGARAAYCCQCANRAPDKRCLAWERIGAREGWKPADKAPRRCRGYEPVTPAAIIRKAAADGVSLALSPAGTIKATGDQAAVSQWVPFLREHKPALLAALARPDPPTLSPDLASRLSPEDLADIAAGDIPLGTIQQYEQAAIAREAEDLREFLEERVGILEHDALLPRADAELEAAKLTATLARNRSYSWASLRAALADYPLLLAQGPATDGPVNALPWGSTHGRRAQGRPRAQAGGVCRHTPRHRRALSLYPLTPSPTPLTLYALMWTA
jgi:hypothetical protein